MSETPETINPLGLAEYDPLHCVKVKHLRGLALFELIRLPPDIPAEAWIAIQGIQLKQVYQRDKNNQLTVTQQLVFLKPFQLEGKTYVVEEHKGKGYEVINQYPQQEH